MFDTAQEQVLDRTLANGPQSQGILYPLVDFLLAEGLHQAQHLDVLPLPTLTHAGLQETAQGIELSGKFPSRQGAAWSRAPTLSSIKGR